MLTSSVIITSHDKMRYEWLEATLRSVYMQTRPADQVFLVSTYNTFPAPTENLACISLPQEERYMSMAGKLNVGISISYTDTFVPLADDDILDPTFLEKTLGAMESVYGKEIAYTDMELIGIDPRTVKSPSWDFENIASGKVIPITSLIKKSVWEASPYKPIDYLDWEFWWQAYDNGFHSIYVDEPLFKYRTHQNQLSRVCDVSEARDKVLQLHKE